MRGPEVVLRKAYEVLRGLVDAETWKECVLSLFFLRHVFDLEQEQAGRFPLPRAARFDALVEARRKPGNATRIKAALVALEQADSQDSRRLFVGSKLDALVALQSETVDEELGNVLAMLGSPAFYLGLSPVREREGVVSAFEYLMSAFPAVSSANAGEHYTPREVVRLMVQLVGPRPGDSLYDPVCGSAGLLLSCANFLKEQHGSREHAIYGQEINPSAWRVSRMNAMVHGEDGRRIECGDTLRQPLHVKGDALERFDVILANPPFSVVVDELEATMAHDRFGRFKGARLSDHRADYAFILHMIASMHPERGRIVTVAPHGVLFRGGGEAEIRRSLIERNLLDAVIGLPPKLFYCTAIPAVILCFRAKRERDDVLFIDASGDYAADRRRNELRPQDIERIVATYRRRAAEPGYSSVVSRQQLAENDFNLSISRYVTAVVEETRVDMEALARRQRELREELGGIQRGIEELLRRLGAG